MVSTLTKVEDPKYMTRDEMEQNYWNKCVLLTNLTDNNGKSVTGGIVRYYARSSKILYEKMQELDLDKESEKYGRTMVFWMGDEPGMLGGLFI
jgi:hypothetical protein